MIGVIKEYISRNKMLRNTLALLAVLGAVFLTIMAIKEKLDIGVKEFRVKIVYEDETKRLINDKYVKEAIRREVGFDITRAKIKDLDLKLIEGILDNNAYVDSVEVYIDGNHVITAELIQKNPIARINHPDYEFYMDEMGDLLPLSPVAAVRVPVITGKFDPVKNDFLKDKKPNQYKDIYQLAKKINEDQFLKALVEQIHIEDDKEFLLIPKIGQEKIILGDVYRLDEKILNLKEFYKEGLTRVGWGKYAYLDLKYEDLVYAQRK